MANQMLAVGRTLWDWAIPLDYVESNPFDKVKDFDELDRGHVPWPLWVRVYVDEIERLWVRHYANDGGPGQASERGDTNGRSIRTMHGAQRFTGCVGRES